MTAAPIIETVDLCRRFGAQLAVDRLSLRVERGDIYGFLGLNGAGKTTTIRMLLGLLRPTSGQVRLFGAEQPAGRRAALAKTGALVESPAFFPHLSGLVNLTLLGSLTRKIDRRAAEAALDQVGLLAAAKKRAADYSLGMKQRLGIALALVTDPELVILDEPTNGLDPNGILEMRKLVRRLNAERGVTFVISSHLLYEIEMTCTRVAILEGGRLVVEETLAELMSGGGEQVLEFEGDPASARAIIESNPGASEVVQDAGAPRFRFRLDRDRGPALVARLVGAGIGVRAFHERRPSLEELFLARANGKKAGRLS